MKLERYPHQGKMTIDAIYVCDYNAIYGREADAFFLLHLILLLNQLLIRWLYQILYFFEALVV